MRSSGDWRKLGLRAGEDVQVRSRDEILRTLDADGRLDGLPFQPEMLAYCGQRLRVWKVAHKTCDTINKTGGRRMSDAVHLEGVRCDGSAHGDCQANCLLFWKEAWLKRPGDPDNHSIAPAACEETVLWRNVTVEGDANVDNDPTWVCQITRLFAATTPLPAWDARQYVQDIQHGNVSAWKMLCTLTQAGYSKLVFMGFGYRALIWLFNSWQKLRGGKPFPLASGLLPRGVKTPTGELDLQIGEWVQIKSADEIRATLGPDSEKSRPAVRSGDGEVLRRAAPGATPRPEIDRGAHRQDDPHEEPLHRAAGRLLPWRMHAAAPRLPAGRLTATGARSGYAATPIRPPAAADADLGRRHGVDSSTSVQSP